MTAKWTLMVYMAGNNSLSEAAGVDLSEMEKSGSSESVRVMAFLKQKKPKSAFHVDVGKGSSEKIELGDVDSGSPQTVVDFARWAIRRAPAERYALVIWNHGSGFAVEDLEEMYGEVRGPTFRELSVRSNQPIARSLFAPTIRQILGQPTVSDRAIATDDGTRHSLDTIELGRIIEAIAEELGRPLDVLGMDACLMSTLEVAYQAHKAVGVIVGSEELEPGAGWSYDRILKGLNAASATDARAFGRLVVKTFTDSYRDTPKKWPVTQCAINAGAIDSLARSIDALEKALDPELAANWPQILRAQTRSVRFEEDLMDLNTFCANIATASLGNDAKAAAASVAEALKPGGFVIAEGHLGPKVEGCGGVTVYFPAPTASISKYYKDLRFAKEHRWDEFLSAYHQAVKAG